MHCIGVGQTLCCHLSPTSMAQRYRKYCKLDHDCRQLCYCSQRRHYATRLRCWQICSDSSRLSPSCELCPHGRRNSTRQLRRVGGVYWALGADAEHMCQSSWRSDYFRDIISQRAIRTNQQTRPITKPPDGGNKVDKKEARAFVFIGSPDAFLHTVPRPAPFAWCAINSCIELFHVGVATGQRAAAIGLLV